MRQPHDIKRNNWILGICLHRALPLQLYFRDYSTSCASLAKETRLGNGVIEKENSTNRANDVSSLYQESVSRLYCIGVIFRSSEFELMNSRFWLWTIIFYLVKKKLTRIQITGKTDIYWYRLRPGELSTLSMLRSIIISKVHDPGYTTQALPLLKNFPWNCCHNYICFINYLPWEIAPDGACLRIYRVHDKHADPHQMSPTPLHLTLLPFMNNSLLFWEKNNPQLYKSFSLCLTFMPSININKRNILISNF